MYRIELSIAGDHVHTYPIFSGVAAADHFCDMCQGVDDGVYLWVKLYRRHRRLAGDDEGGLWTLINFYDGTNGPLGTRHYSRAQLEEIFDKWLGRQ